MRRSSLFLAAICLLAVAALRSPAAATAAVPPATGAIAGHVTDIANGSPLERAAVEVWPRYGYGEELLAFTGPSGDYSIRLLPGVYRVSATNRLGNPRTFFDAATAFWNATDVVVSADVTRTADLAAHVYDEKGAIIGRVVDGSGAPAAGVRVSAVVRDATYLRRFAITEADGSYALRYLVEGPCKLAFQAGDAGLASQWNGGGTIYALAPTVTVMGDSTVTVDATLAPGGSLTGTASGNPWRWDDPGVALFRTRGDAWDQLDPELLTVRFSEVGPSGSRFTISGIPAGTYRVRFGGLAWCSRFLPSVPTTDPGDPRCADVSVSAGAPVELPRTELTPSGALAVRIMDVRGHGIVREAGFQIYRLPAVPAWRDVCYVGSGYSQSAVYGIVGDLTGIRASLLPFLSPAASRLTTTSTGDYALWLTSTDPAFAPGWAGVGVSDTPSGGVHVIDGRTTTVTVTMQNLLPFATLSLPTVPKSVRRNRSFTVTGRITPQHASGSKAIQLYYSRMSVNGWQRMYGPLVRVYASGGSSKYAYTRKLSAGKWRVRAFHVDDRHVQSFSDWHYFTVR